MPESPYGRTSSPSEAVSAPPRLDSPPVGGVKVSPMTLVAGQGGNGHALVARL